jgi:hypothetical protein
MESKWTRRKKGYSLFREEAVRLAKHVSWSFTVNWSTYPLEAKSSTFFPQRSLIILNYLLLIMSVQALKTHL